MLHQERSESLTLSETSPGDARSIVAAFATDWHIDHDVAQRAELLVSEIVADAVDHGSDAATLRITLEEDKLELELFDGPRRSAIARSGRDEGVPSMRMPRRRQGRRRSLLERPRREPLRARTRSVGRRGRRDSARVRGLVALAPLRAGLRRRVDVG